MPNGTTVGSGGHYLRSPDVRVTQVTGEADAAGVTRGYISVRDPQTGGWAPKPAETTFYPESWSKRQTMQEIEGYYKRPAGTGATAWPVYQGKK